MNKPQEYQFVNPYNFIPLGTERKKASSEEEKNLTGVIEYSVLTKTPLFIPNTSSDNAFNTYKEKEEKNKRHKSFAFFTYPDLTRKTEPVIPGSEIRGMFRSNFEILTNSCLSAVDDDVALSRRINLIYQAGLLKRVGENNSEMKFELHEADSYRVKIKLKETNKEDTEDEKKQPAKPCEIDPCIIVDSQNHENDLLEGAKVFFCYNNKNKKVKSITHSQTTSCNKEGYLLKGYPGETKKYCHIFTLKQKDNKMELSSETVDRLDAVLEAYKKVGDHPYTEYKDQFDKFKNGKNRNDFFPVFYSIFSYKDSNGESERIVISPAAITRESYDGKVKDMLGDFKPCDNKKNLCPACSLFGTVKKGTGSFGVTSRIRFSDLTCKEDSPEHCYGDKITLAPLSSPKVNNMEFYLQRPAPDAVFWTYDYYIDMQGNFHHNTEGTINGRKFYWHNMSPDLNDCEPSNLNCTVRPVNKGVLFYGKLYFRNLTKTELNQLIFLLNTGEEAEDIQTANDQININETDNEKKKLDKKTHGYKLGKAKPLGLGSIAVNVRQVKIRKVQLSENHLERYEDNYNEYEAPSFPQNIQRDFLKMTSFNAVEEKNICYPMAYQEDNNGQLDPNVYAWFVENHVKKDRSGEYSPKMTNNWKDIAYAKYMEEMNPPLRSTTEAGRKKVSTGKDLVPGNLYYAIIVNYNKNCTAAKIQIGDEEREYSLFYKNMNPKPTYGKVKESFPIGTQVVVEYKGTKKGGDGKMHDQFEMRPSR